MSGAAGEVRCRWLVVASALLLAACSLAAWYVGAERTIYRDDHIAYWSLSEDLARVARLEPLRAAGAVVRSVPERELNLLPAVPVAAGMLAAGTSRSAYVLLVMALYAVPAVLAVAWVAATAAGTPAAARAAPVATAALVLWLPAFFQPVLLGYLDAGGMVLSALAWVGYLKASGRGPGWRGWAVAGGGAAALAALFRRWYGIGAAGFLAAVAVDGAVRVLAARRGGRAAAGAPAAVTLGTAAVALVAMAAQRLAAIASTDYGDAFAAWNRTSAAGDLVAVLDRFGVLPVAMLLILGGAALAGAARRPVLLLGLQSAVSWVLFHRIQDPSPQHWYLWLPWLLAVSAVGLGGIVARLRPSRARIAIAAVLAGGGLVSAAAVVAGPGPSAGRPGPLGDVRLRPTVRNDLDEIRRLLEVLDGRLRERPGPVYVLAASGPVTDTSLGLANLSLGGSWFAPRWILGSAHVDRRDGFPDRLLAARYVVLPLPVQVPRPPVHNRVVVESAAQIVAGTGVGAAFRPAPERFQLDGGVVVGLWERVRPHAVAEVATLEAALRSWYPDRPFIWQAPPPTGARRESPQPQYDAALERSAR